MNYLLIDAIASFSSEKAQNNDSTIFFLDEGSFVQDEVLWDLGKQAFDIIEGFLDVSNSDLENAFFDFQEQVPNKLIELHQSLAEDFNPILGDGDVLLEDPESGNMVRAIPKLDHRRALDVFELESYIFLLDELMTTFISMGMPAIYPYARREIAAYFTLFHIDASAIDVAMNKISPETYTSPSSWFQRLKLHDHATQTLDAHFARYHREKSARMNSKRHSRRHAALKLVTEEWLTRKNDFPSAEKAGRFFSDWLREQHGIEFEPRTVTEWIRKFAKSKSISFR